MDRVYDAATPIEAFLAAAAARQPAPGGGAIAALAGAMAASMGEMVLQYSVGKKGIESHQVELQAALAEFTRARAILLQFMAEDQAAFEALTTQRKSNDPAAFAAALDACIQIPRAVGAAAAALLELCDRLVDKVNIHLLSDLAVAAELAMASIRSAGYNVRANLADIKHQQARGDLEAQIERQQTRAVALIRRLIPAIRARQG